MAGFLVNPGGTVQTGDIDDGAVTTAKIASGAVTADKVASGVIADQLARDMAASALAYTLAQNDATSITGSIGRFYLSDDFESDSLATKTGSTFASGHYRNTFSYSGDQLTGGTASASAEYTPASRAVNNSQDADGWYSYSQQVPNVWWEYNFGGGNGKVIKRYTIKADGNGSLRCPIGWRFEAFNGSTWDVLQTISGLAGFSAFEERTFDVENSTSYERYRFYFTETNGDGYVMVDEFQMMELSSISNQTLAPTAVTLVTANPTDIAAWIVINPQEAITVGTDIVMTMSIDGGTTDATGTWTKVGDIGSGGKELYRVEADVSAQTGSSLTYEITTANNKEIQYHDCVGIVAIY